MFRFCSLFRVVTKRFINRGIDSNKMSLAILAIDMHHELEIKNNVIHKYPYGSLQDG